MGQNTGVSQGVKLPSGKSTQQTGDPQGNVGVAFGHAEKYGSAYASRVFFAATATPVTTSVGLATTYTGLCLSNPAGSGVNLAIQTVTGQLVVAPTVLTALGILVGYAAGGITAHTTPLTAGTFGNAKLNAAAPVGLVDTACTLVGTPMPYRFLAETPTATSVVAFQTEVRGGLLIPPGGYVALYTSAASAASGFLGSIEWEECGV